MIELRMVTFSNKRDSDKVDVCFTRHKLMKEPL